jgi:hypothetical protein
MEQIKWKSVSVSVVGSQKAEVEKGKKKERIEEWNKT